MHIQPIGKRTIVKPIENSEAVTTGGIILSTTVQEKYSDVAIVEASDKFSSGDKVLIPPYEFSQIVVDGQAYLIVNTEDVMGIINEK